MPIDIMQIANEKLPCCKECDKLVLSDTGIIGYSHECLMLKDSAFSVIPDDVVLNNEVFPDCPKLHDTVYEGLRYKVLRKQ